jgi:hypothetical protein
MKTPEDEAWEEMERKQGAGGFPAKRAMAADKLHWSDCAVHNAPAYPAGACDCDARLSKYAETLLEEATRSCNNIDEQRALDALMLDFHKPAQEPVAQYSDIASDGGLDPRNQFDAPQRERVLFPTMLRKMWSGGEVQAWLDENVNKEQNNGT